MIQSFKHKGLKRLYEKNDASLIGADIRKTVREILSLIDAARKPSALELPGYRLHPLKGDLKGYWSMTVRANRRIIFRFEGEDAYDVELIDYH